MSVKSISSLDVELRRTLSEDAIRDTSGMACGQSSLGCLGLLTLQVRAT
jgi:hypothetical protein